MGQTWRFVFMLLTALQASPSLALPGVTNQHGPQGHHQPAHQAASSSLPWARRAWDDPPSSKALTSPAKVITSITPSGTAQILADKKKPAGGFVHSVLDTFGHATAVPILTKPIPTPTALLPIPSVVASLKIVPSILAKMLTRDIFADPISTDAPPANIGRKQDHPVRRLGITDQGPFETNKFYGNFHLGNQTSPTFLHPFSVAWARGQGASGSWGLAVSHIDGKQRVYGQASPGTGAAAYFINPIGIHSVCLSAVELGPDTALTTDSLTDLSIQVSLRPTPQAPAAVRSPLVQGSAFITAVYDGACPLLQTGVFFRSVTRATADPKPGVTKYKLHLEDGATWLVYARHAHGAPLDLEVVNNGLARARAPFYGTVQVTKDPDGSGEAVYDVACGVYATGVQLSGTAAGARGSYTFSFKKEGLLASPLAMFALPHHQGSFDGATRACVTGVALQTTTKGTAVVVLADAWTMVEEAMPVDLGFLPWTPEAGTVADISEGVRARIREVALREVSQKILEQTDENSMYFSGKALAKFAGLMLAIQEMLGDRALAQAGLAQLKVAFSRYSQNAQKYALVYESGWGGVVSSATYVTGDPGVDFGNTMYNDHHFHWGYFIYTAAVIGYLDPSWIPANRAYVDMLVRDIANPSKLDPYFPLWRSFDWFHGHSWAHGLFDTLDGKDQESSSEDTMHVYALKLWGAVTFDRNLEARANLMLALQARSLQSYYLYTADNTVQPPEFIGNKVAGILFENKIDHTTYFGTNIEYIQGIHMLPVLPHAPLVRTPRFVREEWETYFAGGRADAVQGGWRGILYANYATVDPRGAYAFFSQGGFDPAWLDGGASLTWYLCYSAALGGL